MAVSKLIKQQIIQNLLVTKQKSHNLEMTLRFKGQTQQADLVAAKTQELTAEIDTLLVKLLDEWLTESVGVVGEIRSGNTRLQTSIRKVSQGVQTAQNIVKAIGFVDDAIAIAARISTVI